jgi:hypothetical protein
LNKIVLIFDYFKEAFRINKSNKSLYKPQIALIAVKVFMTLFVGIGVYNWVAIGKITSLTAMEPNQILGFMLSQGFKLLAIILAYALISIVVESGLLNMYKKAVTQGHTEAGDFKEGVSKYFFKLLLGEILIILCYIPILPIILILGIVTLTVGLTVIPLVIAVFLTMWKISLVMNDTGIFDAAKDSFSFAKRNFIPLTVLQIIHWAFSSGVSGGGSGGGGGSNISNINNINNGVGEGLGNEVVNMPAMTEVIRIIKLVIVILLPVISIVIVTVSVIAMIFEVFFSLTLFVVYKNDFKIEEKQIVLLEEPTEAETPQNSEVEGFNEPDEVDNHSDEEEASDKEVEQ